MVTNGASAPAPAPLENVNSEDSQDLKTWLAGDWCKALPDASQTPLADLRGLGTGFVAQGNDLALGRQEKGPGHPRHGPG